LEVVGTSPEYKAPAGQSRVSTRLPTEVESALNAVKPKRNIVRDNLKPANYTAKTLSK
jgi:hypothetical protein